jgi:hypothetical protein
MRAGTASGRRAGRAIVAFRANPMSLALGLQARYREHACQHDYREKFIHVFSPIGNLGFR